MIILALCWVGAAPGSVRAAEEVRIAVASNFAPAMKELAEAYRQETGREVRPVFGSTGKLFAQIVNGAPYAAFLAADARRPRLLEEQGQAVPGTRFTYALGTLVLWSPDAARSLGESSLGRDDDFRFLAIANPKLAPYGAAARQVLEAMGVWDRLQPKIVRGENIAQAYQYVASGNAELGFVALSQLEAPGRSGEGSRWMVPGELHDPIAQQAVLLREDSIAREFLNYLKGAEARAAVASHGYGLP